VTRVVAGERKRYDYTRGQFTNNSDGIRGLCGWALEAQVWPSTTRRGACYALAERL
jgi:hypothetical protein